MGEKSYAMLILHKYVRATALNGWQGIYCIEPNDRPDIFKLYYFCTRETKLQSLQFKLLHRIIHCKNWVHDHQVVNTPTCEMCQEEKVDDMTHHFIECSGLNNFWNVFGNWSNITATYPI